MRGTTHYLLLVCCVPMGAVGQYSIGLQGGPLFFQGSSEATNKALTNTSAYTVGAQLLEGGAGETGFRFGLDLCHRTYDLTARQPLTSRMERLRSGSDLLQFAMEVRWSLSEELHVSFDFGPLFGVEIREKRAGVSYYQDGPASGSDTLVIDEVEVGFAITDIRLRIGMSMEFPLHGAWSLSSGMHLSWGHTTWARDHAYGTFDGQLRAGLVRMLGAPPSKPR